MALVDFSNATFEPILHNGDAPYVNQYDTLVSTSSAYRVWLTDSTGTVICNSTFQKIEETAGSFTAQLQGILSANGTEMYVGLGGSSSGETKANYWKISNVSFSSGDTVFLNIKQQIV